MAQYAWEIAPLGLKSLSLNELWRSPLCNDCQSIFHGAKKVGNAGLPAEHVFPQSFKRLESSSQTCQLCYLRWEQLSSEERNELRNSTIIKYFFYTLGKLSGLVFEYEGISEPIRKEFRFNDGGNLSENVDSSLS